MTDHFQLAEEFFERGEFEKACEEYEQSVVLQSDHVEAYIGWGCALNELTKYEEAIAKYRQAIGVNANSAEAYFYWGNTLGILNQYEEAITKFERATELNPDFFEAYNNWRFTLVKWVLTFVSFEQYEKAVTKYQKAIIKYQKVTEFNPNYAAEVYYYWGIKLFNLKQYEKATTKYQKVTELNPDYFQAYFNWGYILGYLEKDEEAIIKYQKAIDLNPNYSEAYYSWGNALYNLKKYEDAITKYQKAIDLNPNYSEAYFSWGNALGLLQRYEEAISKYQEMTKLNPDYSKEAYYYWGNALYNLKKYEKAITKYQKAIELNPNYSEAYNRWGKVLCNLKEYEDAITKYQKAIELNPNYSEAYYGWGNALENIEQYEEAIKKYNQAKKNDSNYFIFSLSYASIASVYWKQGAYKEGRKRWSDAAEIYERLKSKAEQGKNAYYFFVYGIILEVLNDLERAKKQYKKGLEIDPNNIAILTNLVDFYLDKKDQGVDDASPSCLVKARQYYIKARNFLKDELNQLEDTETLLTLAKLHLSMDEYQEAESYLLKALEKDSDFADIYTSLGTLSVNKENFREATDYFKKALKIAPYDLDIWSNLAEAYLKLKQLSQAESEYRKILGIAPCHVESHIGLGEVYIEMGDEGESDLYSQAIKHFDKAIKISNEREGSKILNKKELSGIYYLRGYARVKIYENPVGIKDGHLLLEAQGDFAKCIDKDPENNKGITAHKKLEKQMEIQTIQSFTNVFGAGIIWFSSILILGITNLVFWQPFLSNNQNNKVSVSQPSPQPIKTPNASPNSTNSTQSQTKIDVNKTSEPDRINTTEYFLLTFGSLTFSLISLYLPQLLKLKIGGTGIEIEKSSIDQIKTSQIPTSLGIKK